ncbi:regulator of microtubule dynamics protein 2 isoform X2 [Notamacropus eugenii]
MSQSTSKGLIFGIIMGTAGISLIIVWYQKIRKPGTTMNLPKFLSLSNEFHSIDLQDAVHNERGTVVVLQQSQFQILEKLNDLLVSVEELKEEVRFLKEAIPELEKHVRGELRGKTAIHRTSPQHQAARKKKAEASRGISTSNSSEEAESEGGCCISNRASTADSSQDQVASGSCQHGAVPVPQKDRLFIACKVTKSSLRKPVTSSPKENNSNLEKHCIADLPSTSRDLLNSQQNVVSPSCLQTGVNVTSNEPTSSSDIQKSEDSSYLGIKRFFSLIRQSIHSTTTSIVAEKYDNFFPANRPSSTHLKSIETSFSCDPQQDGINFDVAELGILAEFHLIDEIHPHVTQSEFSPKFDQNEAVPSHSQVLPEASTSQENTSKPCYQSALKQKHHRSIVNIILSISGLSSVLWKRRDSNDTSQREDALGEPQDNSTSNTQEDRILSEYPLSEEIILHMPQSRISPGATSASPPDSLDHCRSKEAINFDSSQDIKNWCGCPSMINDLTYPVRLSSLFKKERKNDDLKSQSTSVSHNDDEVKPSSSWNRYVTAQSDTEKGNLAGHKANKKSAKKLSLPVLTRMIDDLHLKSDSDKRKSFDLLCNYKNKYKDETEFIWRLTRAYGDMCDLATDMEEKRKYASEGKDLGERAIAQAPKNGYCHLWFANLCGYVAEYGGLQNRIRYGHLFKKHLDIALEFIPDEPLLYYLNGRYCYSVFKLNWMEKKMASALFGMVPTSSVEEALRNFLKAEELKPGYSKYNYVYLAKCYKDLGQKELALMYCDSALLISSVNKQDHQAQEELENIILSLK